LGRGGALKLNDTFWKEFLNNAAFFTLAQKNYFEGAATALSSASLSKAIELFRKQTDEEGKPIGATPRYLPVPPELETVAMELYRSLNNNTGGASANDRVPNTNIHGGKYEPVVSSYLSNTSLAGQSSTAWYLLADPMDVPVIEVAFLGGVETPTIETVEVDADEMGVGLLGYWDFGVAKQEFRGGVKSKGAA
jgi:phage major head subunit gpT-like protein